ncbi:MULTISPECIES: hypothetical protein [unclassified Pseudomonas]|uniref:hypothetical protein n=1 Tax=unclassified Pseudomonas TaxID=196821 RepID=UPI000A1E5E4C|nr:MULTISPECIES: hypothetical protein [unclassified Pseudomonas]
MKRGSAYWMWADCRLPTVDHHEVTSNGIIIDVQARLSKIGIPQLFIGVYNSACSPIFEEAYLDGVSDTVTTTLHWGIYQARQIAAGFGEKGRSISHR